MVSTLYSRPADALLPLTLRSRSTCTLASPSFRLLRSAAGTRWSVAVGVYHVAVRFPARWSRSVHASTLAEVPPRARVFAFSAAFSTLSLVTLLMLMATGLRSTSTTVLNRDRLPEGVLRWR